MSGSTSRPAFQVNSTLLNTGLVLLCFGFLVWVIGALVSGTALAQAARNSIAQMKESPSEIARRRARQLKVAASAGSKAWREESH